MRRLAPPLLSIGCAVLCGCLPWAGLATDGSGSVGTVSRGLLASPRQLPLEGPGYRFYRTGARRYGTPELTGLLERSARRVESAHPGSKVLIGELSAREGGYISGHRSHRSGRDVDLAFFVTGPDGRPVGGTPLAHYDRFGVAVRGKQVCRFDARRNWALVEALLADEETAVQWIFVSRGLKALLLEWGLSHGADLTLIDRAASVLHQPSGGLPHDDHFHVRVYCGAGASAGRCRDVGPRWPWIGSPGGRRSAVRGDRDLLALALDGL
jgi:penicillin-insensitive murein endopeptidase